MLLNYGDIVTRGWVRSYDFSGSFSILQSLAPNSFVHVLSSITSLPVVLLLLLHCLRSLGGKETLAQRVLSLGCVSSRRLHLICLHHGLWSLSALTSPSVAESRITSIDIARFRLHFLLTILNAIFFGLLGDRWLIEMFGCVCYDYVGCWELLLLVIAADVVVIHNNVRKRGKIRDRIYVNCKLFNGFFRRSDHGLIF